MEKRLKKTARHSGGFFILISREMYYSVGIFLKIQEKGIYL